MSKRKHDPILAQLMTVAVVALLTIAFFLGIYVAYHHGGSCKVPSVNIINRVNVTTNYPNNPIDPGYFPANGKG